MILWRISCFAELSGAGSNKYPGRWNSVGRPIVYIADTPSLALLEKLVHARQKVVPKTYQLLKITSVTSAKSCPDLPDDWAENELLTRKIGDDWLAKGSSALLKVPSVILPDSFNYLLNPSHSDADKLQITETKRFAVDPRLI